MTDFIRLPFTGDLVRKTTIDAVTVRNLQEMAGNIKVTPGVLVHCGEVYHVIDLDSDEVAVKVRDDLIAEILAPSELFIRPTPEDVAEVAESIANLGAEQNGPLPTMDDLIEVITDEATDTGLCVSSRDGIFYWSISCQYGDDWGEIPESLYREIVKFHESKNQGPN